jgi:alkylhydroperoxidase family enzyme
MGRDGDMRCRDQRAEAYAAARAVFEERELVDLTIAIGVMNTYNRMTISYRNTPQAALSASSIE